MSISVNVYHETSSRRGVTIANAMASGLRRHGRIRIRTGDVRTFRTPNSDVAIFYGLHRTILDAYRDAGLVAIYVDLGYWGRHEGGRRSGFHKLAINGRHPTPYFQRRTHGPERFRHFGIRIAEARKVRKGNFILLAGMSAKAAKAEGFAPEEWERDAAVRIRQHTDRPIIYRPKPNWHHARDIPGTRMERGVDGQLSGIFASCHAVVTHHSNVAVDALLAGIPVFCEDGVATAPGKAFRDLSELENPPQASGVEQWAYDLAFTQWKVCEIGNGEAWEYLKNDGLVPA